MKSEGPGPGQYDDLKGINAAKKTNPSYRIGTAPRGRSSDSLSRTEFPGPGAYENG